MASAGFSSIELLMVLAIASTVVGIAAAGLTSGLDEMRTAMAARYLASRVTMARLEALQRSARVALRFEADEGGYGFSICMDGNRNGVRAVDVASGADPVLHSRERLGDRFADVRFGLAGAIPDLDGRRELGDGDGIHIGTARILTMGPDGTATSGTLYVRGRRAQYAVRVLGATARTRVYRYHTGTGTWQLQ